MKTLLDEILSQAMNDSDCGCAACAEKAAGDSNLYDHWKDRRQQRLGTGREHPHRCNCNGCRAKRANEFENGSAEFPSNWRRRRQIRYNWNNR